jgi:Fe-S cluster biogenesis protein NfuA
VLVAVCVNFLFFKSFFRLRTVQQVDKIAWMRLLACCEACPTGFLTCHVLDTCRGCPAANMRVTLHRIQSQTETSRFW